VPALEPGLYDRLITLGLAQDLQAVAAELKTTALLTPDDSHLIIGRTLQRRLIHALDSLTGDDRLARQVELANDVLSLLLTVTPKAGALESDRVPDSPERLLAILELAPPPAKPRAPKRPNTSLSSSELLVNGRHELSLGPELALELGSADRVDLLCSFVKWSGLRIVDAPLQELLRRRPQSVRLLTTTYMGSTEQRALERLVELGAAVRVSYDESRTRLHAKAWLLHRRSGFSTAFVGSSNLSSSAVLDGLEWNVRLSQIDNPAILAKFEATFRQYWDDGEFRNYDPNEFREAIANQQRHRVSHLLRFDLRPRPHQQQILDELAAERGYGHSRNLVVAATGTGKTVVAALDYKRLRGGLDRARLLFVAHRREILDQSRTTFQVALADGAFGELLGDGQVPTAWEHVFANIQSLSAERLATIAADHFDVVIVDEFHHAASDSYDRLLAHVRPKFLLGLTATPERADGQSVLRWFDGRIASEMRLWTALEQLLLCPFQYFAIGAGPNLSGVQWTRGRYDTRALSNVYTADHLFALRVLQETHAKVRDIKKMRALGFCVDLAHAAFMVKQFEEHGVVATVLSGGSSSVERERVIRGLRSGAIQIVFTVDLFNEGVDLPEVDTLLFLRPTESATVFLQQLGRGLRRSEGKECCTVLDFVSPVDRRFRFDLRYRAIVGGTRRQLEQQVAQGFPALPSGCFIHLDEHAREVVLANVRAALGSKHRGLVEDLRGLARDGAVPTLAEFLVATQTDLEDVYASDWTWTRLRRAAGIEASETDVSENSVERALARMLHIDDDRLEAFTGLLDRPTPPAADPADPYQRMLFALIGYYRAPYDQLSAAWSTLWQRPWLRAELLELLNVLRDRRRARPQPLDGRLGDLPLRVHGTYSRDEVFAAFDQRDSKNQLKRTQGGIFDVKARQTELLFVELEKSEHDYTPTTLYNDYPVTPQQFHWDSQAGCHPGTPAGKRYLNATPGSTQEVLLFVRRRRKDERGLTLPYLLLGPCDLLEHSGERPMQIEWRLRTPMPAWFFQAHRVAG
jgi:superfamily II DNA or RNA helicase/HKD family nuclease